MYHFCTYFDHHFLARGLALHRSLEHHCPSFQLWVLCMDRACYDVLSQLKLTDVHLIALEDFERGDEELLGTKQNRTPIEYYFTCTPSLPLFILNNHPEVDIITYLDADLFFFADPTPMYDEMGARSIAIIGHRFPALLRNEERHGIYNVGWLSFRRGEQAFVCLRWWRERCIAWCYDRVEGARFADQKYLDDWPVRFSDVVVLQHKGANLAPWNIVNYNIREKDSRVWVDDFPLIFYHFHDLRRIRNWLFDPQLAKYSAKLSKVMLKSIYGPYIRTLSALASQVSPLLGKDSIQNGMRYPVDTRQSSQYVSLLHRATRNAKGLLRLCRGLFLRRYIFSIYGHIV